MLLSSQIDKLKNDTNSFLRAISHEKQENVLENRESSLIRLLSDQNPRIRKLAVFFITLNGSENPSFRNNLMRLLPFKSNEQSKGRIILFNYPKKINPKLLITMKKAVEKCQENYAYSVENNEKRVWFYPSKIEKSDQINSLEIENYPLDLVVEDPLFPDPFFYFIGFHFSSEGNDHYKNLRPLSFTQSFHCSPMNLPSSQVSSSRAKKKDISPFAKEKSHYDAIKDTDFFFDENKRFLTEMNKVRERLEKPNKSTSPFERKHEKDQGRSKLEKKFHREVQKESPESAFKPTPEINVNQLSASAIASHRWRNEATKQRILRMVPEFSQEKYYFKKTCSRMQDKAKSVCSKDSSTHSKSRFSEFKEKGILNCSLDSYEYLKLLTNLDENKQKIFGFQSHEYEKILKFCQIDQIDYSKPDLGLAVRDLALINQERKIIRGKIKGLKTSSPELKQELNDQGRGERVGFKKKGRVLRENKRVEIKNSGLILKKEWQEGDFAEKKERMETKKSPNLIPTLVKTLLKARERSHLRQIKE